MRFKLCNIFSFFLAFHTISEKNVTTEENPIKDCEQISVNSLKKSTKKTENMKTNVLFIFFKLTLSPINLQLNVTPGNYINKTARKNENVPCPRHKYKIHLRIHTTHSVQLTCNSI